MKKTKLWRFHGGLVLPDHKASATQAPIQTLPLSQQYVLPLQQAFGDTASPLVNIGDQVLKGQAIAQIQDELSVGLHAPTSGVIQDIQLRPIPHANNFSAPCIILESDGEDRWIELQPHIDFTTLSPTQIRERIRDAGIVGLGGAGFPSFIKLTSAEKIVDCLIINGAECEPYISCDMMLMHQYADEILNGITIMQYALNARRVIIAIEDNKPDAIHRLQTALAQNDFKTDIQLVIIPTRYPTGGERQLIQVLTGQEVPSGQYPIDIGMVCHNPGTAYAVYRAIYLGEPLISRIVTLTGDAISSPNNYEVLIGTPINDLLTHAQTAITDNLSIVQGGPMMGFPLADATLPITKTANCILVNIQPVQPQVAALPCIRCGDCVDVCPAKLLPQQLYWYAKDNDLERAQQYRVNDCIECGCCDYVCPSQIPLVSYFRSAKLDIRQQQVAQQKAEFARQRYEARQARLEQEQIEKEARLQKRKAELAAMKNRSAVTQKPLTPPIKPQDEVH